MKKKTKTKKKEWTKTKANAPIENNNTEISEGQLCKEKYPTQEPDDLDIGEKEASVPAKDENTSHTTNENTSSAEEKKVSITEHLGKVAALGYPSQSNHLPKNYWGYLLLLIFTLALFTILALKVDDHALSFELKKMNVDQYCQTGNSNIRTEPDAMNDSTSNADSPALPTIESGSTATDGKSTGGDGSTASYENENTDSTGVRFLLIGDSMNEFLRIRLNDYCIKNGYKMDCVIWYGSTTKQYGTCDTLAYFIHKFHPTYVLLTIGSNELFIRDIIKKRTEYVQHIVKQLGNIPFVWIGPPNWKEDTGINQLILQHVGPSRYFESKKLSFNRCKDGAHPTKSSAFDWCDHIAEYLSTEAYPTIEMNAPDTNYNKTPHTTILQMIKE